MAKTLNCRLTYKERVKIYTLAKIGWTQTAIAQQLRIPQRTVSRCLQLPTTPTKPKGRLPLLNTLLRHLLVRHATKNVK